MAAVAKPSAQNQYVLPDPSATGSGHPRGDGAGSGVPAASSSGGSGNAVLPILLGGLVVIGGSAAVLVYRKRRNQPRPPE